MNNRLIFCTFAFIVCSACQHATKNTPQAKINPSKLAIISINDVYRIAGIDAGKIGGLARIRALREQLEQQYSHVLLLHAGDFLHPSFISKQDNGRAMIQTLNMLDGVLNQFDENMVVTWGNHEFDKGRMKHVSMMNELLSFSEFTWLDSNIVWQENSIQSDQMQRYKIYDYEQFKVGIYSITTDVAHPEYVDSFTHYANTSAEYVPKLRAQGADFVIALTHQWLPDDLSMMKLPVASRPDIIFGGHEHYFQTEQVNGRWILKADADGASAVVAEVDFSAIESPQVQPQVIQLNEAFPENQTVASLIQDLSDSTDQKYCKKMAAPADCLTEVLGFTTTALIAEETEIRRFETNLGNELADLVLDTFNQCQADVALLNSGSIRLNQNIPEGAGVTVKHLEEMFPYPSDLRLIEFDSDLLPDILQHSISSWTANGHWLQVAGLAFIHDPDQTTVSHIHVLNRPEHEPSEASKIRAVVPYYLIANDTDHDGYDMLNESMLQDCDQNGAQLKTLFTDLLQNSPQGLNAIRDGRICNTVRDGCN